jgi:hypothetical protein
MAAARFSSDFHKTEPLLSVLTQFGWDEKCFPLKHTLAVGVLFRVGRGIALAE